MIQRKNPYTLKGFMSILQGNNKPVVKNSEVKKDEIKIKKNSIKGNFK